MPSSEEDRLSAQVQHRQLNFHDGLSDQRRDPLQRFEAFAEAARLYARLTRAAPLIQRKIAGAVSALTDFV